MKKFIISALFWPLIASASPPQDPPEVTAALEFNRWYISQLTHGNSPGQDYTGLSRYVTASTVASLKRLDALDPYEYDVPDSDMFIKAQNFGTDWVEVTALALDYDAACSNVYIAFGKKQYHIVIDCMIKEDGAWKVQSVASLEFSRNLK